MSEKYWYLLLGVAIGWAFKIPFLIKWYRELRKTRSYELMKNELHYEEVKARWLEMRQKKQSETNPSTI